MNWHEELDEIRNQPIDISQAVAELLSGKDLDDVDWIALDMKGRERNYAYLLIAQRKIINEQERKLCIAQNAEEKLTSTTRATLQHTKSQEKEIAHSDTENARFVNLSLQLENQDTMLN